MNDYALDKIKQLQELAKEGSIMIDKHPSDQIDLNKGTALSRVIKSKEDAELFMNRLESLT